MAKRDQTWLDTLFPENAERKIPWSNTNGQVTLYRPIGIEELKLIAEADYRVFPPRLPDQPIFYPVLNFAYAEEIAKGWNTKRDSYAGFVTRFNIEGSYARRFDIYIVGSEHMHQELWVPAEELEVFNQHIQGQIEVIAAYYGPGFKGEVDPKTNFPKDL